MCSSDLAGHDVVIEQGVPVERKLGTDELPPLDDLFDAYGVHISGGWGFRSPVVEMPGYMRALRQRVADAGGQFEKRQLTSLTDAAPHNADVVVNCAGLGNAPRTGRLERDPDLYPIRGQVVKVVLLPRYCWISCIKLDISQSSAVNCRTCWSGGRSSCAPKWRTLKGSWPHKKGCCSLASS